MTVFLRQSTASQEVLIGPFVDSTDANSEETGFTIANTDVLLHKHGGTTLPTKNSGGATHISNGLYYVVLDATDTNTIGNLIVLVHFSGALWVKQECVVLDEAVYDALFGTVALATATNITAGTIATVTTLTNLPAITANWLTAAGINTGAFTAAKFAAGAIDAAALAADAGTEIGTAVWAAAARTLTAATSITSTGGSVPITAGGLVSSDVTAISTDTAAADNAESFFDGSGYAGTGNTIPTVTTVGTVNALAANSLTAAAAAADLTTELQSGLATAAALATTDGKVDLIKAKTDPLTFTVANQVDANIQSVNDVTVNGVGSAGNPWGP